MKSAKYLRLMYLKQKGVKVPETLYLRQEDSKNIKTIVAGFTERFPDDQQFIVRSAIPVEDGDQLSYAGHFKSSEPVRPSQLPHTIQEIIAENERRARELQLRSSADCMIQPFITPAYGGVAFYPWKYFLNHALISHSPHGPEYAVEGRNTHEEIISLTKNGYTPLNSGFLPEKIKKSLRQELNRIAKISPEPVDIEWAITETGACMILQIRSLTSPMNGLFPTPDSIEQEMEHEIGYPLSSLKADAMTTNLNFLSPLGFHRLQNRYRQASSLLKNYGINMSMEQFPFIRLPTGHILTEPSRNHRFISFANPLQSLLFPLRSRKIRQEIIDYLKGNHKDASTSFAYFQLINIICSMTKAKIAAPLISSPFEYEPTLSTPLPENPPRLSESPNWNELRNRIKYEYLQSEKKIRDEQEDDPFSNDRQLYEKELAYSIYDPLGRTNKTAGFQWVSGIGTEEIDGTIVTEHTMREQQSKAEKLIFVGDYFPNEYIVHLHQFSGILLTKGSHLSHSAIVARERSIPYLIGIPEEKEKELQAEEKIRLSLPSLKKIH